jgi:hypothetical protein
MSEGSPGNYTQRSGRIRNIEVRSIDYVPLAERHGFVKLM